MALLAMVPTWSWAIGANGNVWIGSGFGRPGIGTRRVGIGRALGGREPAERRARAIPGASMGLGRAHSRGLTAVGINVAVPGASYIGEMHREHKGGFSHSRTGARHPCAVASDSQSDDIQSLVEGDNYEETETEDEARTRNWKERGWAPWEELRTPEAQFAIDSLADNEEEPALSWEDFQKLNKKKSWKQIEEEMDEAADKEEEERVKSAKFEGSLWEQPLVLELVPPRDWPPPGWKVDAKELAHIREVHTTARPRITPQDLEPSKVQPEGAKVNASRWEMFLKQYDEWVAANRHIQEQEALEVDEEYYAGRRRTGEDYKEGMYELPFVYPGQNYIGVVTYVSLYEGAFVYYGGVHDGWVPIMDNDWYEVRKYIKVGVRVQVEVIAKRDPYRFRFPVQMRFVDPNIDHLIFRRFKYPPIFGRKEDTNLDEVARESNRPYYPKLRPEVIPELEETEAPVHPFIKRLWMVHEAEKMVLEDEEGVHDDDGDDEEWEELATMEEDDPTGEWANEPGILHETDEDLEIPTIVLHVDEKYLNLDVARVEREASREQREAAWARGEEFDEPKGRFERRMKELNDMHQQRWAEEREALVRDRTCRLELGLPLEEPGRYADKDFWGKNPYDPREPQWRHDYWGDPAKIKDEIRKDREPRARPEEAAEAEDEDDELLDVLGGDVTMIREEGVDLVKERGFIYDDADARLIFGESEDIGAVNGTATKSLTAVSDVIEIEDEDWQLNDDGEAQNIEGDEGDEGDDGAGDKPTSDNN